MTKEHHDGFVRQRRSLILISLVLSVLVWFGIDGTKVRLGPGGGAGLTVDLVDTRIIYAGLYIMWAWFVVRYWQYYSAVRSQALNSLRGAQMRSIKKVFGKRLTALAEHQASEMAKRKRSEWRVAEVGILDSQAIVRDGWRSVSQRFKFAVAFEDQHGSRQSDKEPVHPTARITGVRLYWPLLRAIAPVHIKHPYFTEYRLPFVVAAAPLLALALRWESVFPGSVLAIVNSAGCVR